MNFLKQIFWGILAFSLILLFCEAFIRSSNIANLSFNDFDPKIGKVHTKNTSYLLFNEGMGMGHFNEYGYLHKAYPPQRKENTLRLALMGDSYVAGMQVMERHHFRNLLEEKLNSDLDKEVEVLNFGRAGFDMSDLYALKSTFVSQFEPDYFVLLIAAQDFFPKNTDVLVPKVEMENGQPEIKLDFPEKAVEKYEFVKKFPQNSTVMNMLNNGLKKPKQVPLGSIIFDKIYYWFYPAKSGSDVEYKNMPIPEVVKGMIGNLDPEKVIFVNRDRFPLPEEAMGLIGGFPYIDLSVGLRAMEEAGNSPIEWPITGQVGHWNHVGHEAVSNMLEEGLKEYIK